MDILKMDNVFDSFSEYQTCMIEQFDTMAKEFDFKIIDANLSINATNTEIMTSIQPILTEYNK